MNAENLYIEGGCYCGEIKYQIRLPVKWCAHCHCTQCRHTQGAPLVTWFGVDKSQFKLLCGEASLNWFASSESAKRAHCKTCGTPLFFMGEQWANEVHITRESTQQDIQLMPSVHVFYDRHVNYLTIDDKLLKKGGTNGFTILN
ncbi:MAG: hypothetical protein COW84_11670 [Gammaproteobacteria bacterium CG22_combo_CG10-13_8_21_14_all_40_8]|nr:MAG: hypothetical protein COW84_11670 [Gammaproteobacteria bacterium CG22_combo_CG10-13_8_21_14_all_40_8]